MLTLLHLLSSIALLVWGTHIVRTGIMRVYGSHLRRLLGRSMGHTPLAFGAGIGVTALVQSSNATALLVISFVAQGLMALPTALAIMLGADVGTALMARVLTMDLSWLSPLLTLLGVCLFLSRKQSRSGQLGRVLIGMGLIILALQLIVQAAAPITEARGMRVLFSSLAGDTLLAVVVGAVFALLSYSSLAAVLLIATLAGAGLIGLPVALGVVIGANVGSGLLAWLNASLQPVPARRVALGNLLYKLAGLAVLPFLEPLVTWMGGFGFSTQTQVIGFHLAYNSLRCLLLLPTVPAMAHLCENLLPERQTDGGVARPRHLDPAALETPSLALANATRETLRIGDLVELMLVRLLEALREDRPEPGEEIRRLDDDVDALYNAVKLYLARMPRDDLAEDEQRRWAEIIELAINLEQAGDSAEHMLGKLRDPENLDPPAIFRTGPGRVADAARAVASQPAPGALGVPFRRCQRCPSIAPAQARIPPQRAPHGARACGTSASRRQREPADQLGAPGAHRRHETAQLAVLQHRACRAGGSRARHAAVCRGASGRPRLGPSAARPRAPHRLTAAASIRNEAPMLDWVREYQPLLTLMVSTCTLLVWLFYAHLLLANFKRQRRPNLIINRGAGKGLTSLCLISNMSAEPMFINQVLICLDTNRGSLLGDVTDIRESQEDEATPDLALYQTTHQGPLRSGDFTHIGSFQALLRRAAEQHGIDLRGHQPEGEWQFLGMEIRVVAFYGSDRHPLGVSRRFTLDGAELLPDSPLTRQLCTRRERRQVRAWMVEHVGQAGGDIAAPAGRPA